jgi:hypothetical protein
MSEEEEEQEQEQELEVEEGGDHAAPTSASAGGMPTLTEAMALEHSKKSSLARIEKLNLWGSGLGDVSIISRMINIQVLSLSVNKISTLEAFRNLPHLRELFLRKCKISRLEEVGHLRTIPNLNSLWLEDNPISLLESYRDVTLACTPLLLKLDNVPVTEEERRRSQQEELLPPATSQILQGAIAVALGRGGSARRAGSSSALSAILLLLGDLSEESLRTVRKECDSWISLLGRSSQRGGTSQQQQLADAGAIPKDDLEQLLPPPPASPTQYSSAI